MAFNLRPGGGNCSSEFSQEALTHRTSIASHLPQRLPPRQLLPEHRRGFRGASSSRRRSISVSGPGFCRTDPLWIAPFHIVDGKDDSVVLFTRNRLVAAGPLRGSGRVNKIASGIVYPPVFGRLNNIRSMLIFSVEPSDELRRQTSMEISEPTRI
jgi:hypothetical protein